MDGPPNEGVLEKIDLNQRTLSRNSSPTGLFTVTDNENWIPKDSEVQGQSNLHNQRLIQFCIFITLIHAYSSTCLKNKKKTKTTYSHNTLWRQRKIRVRDNRTPFTIWIRKNYLAILITRKLYFTRSLISQWTRTDFFFNWQMVKVLYAIRGVQVLWLRSNGLGRGGQPRSEED